jgi:hypothetical protein
VTPLPTLLLPIFLSAVFVFIASFILWMALPFWHRKDYVKLAEESTVVGALRAAASGQYVVPHMDWNKMTPEQRAEAHKGPMALLIVRNPNEFSFAKTLVSYFIYMFVVMIFIGYLAGIAMPPGTHYMRVFRIVGTAGVLAFSFNTIADSIWYGKPWSVTWKNIIDGVIFGLLAAGTFGWLWPAA